MNDVSQKLTPLNKQFSDARETFSNIADRQADAIKVNMYIL